MDINFWPLCTVSHVPHIAQVVDARGVLWTTGARVVFRGIPHMQVLEKYRGIASRACDEGLYAHELRHVGQFWSLGLLAAFVVGVLTAMALGDAVIAAAAALAALLCAHPLAYTWCRWYRLQCEMAAYVEQIKLPDGHGQRMSIETAAARLLAPKYAFGFADAAAATAAMVEYLFD